MNETCDCCRKKASVLEIVFTGLQYLCFECAAKKTPTTMGLSSHWATSFNPIKKESSKYPYSKYLSMQRRAAALLLSGKQPGVFARSASPPQQKDFLI